MKSVYVSIQLLLFVALLAACTTLGSSDKAWGEAMTRNTQLRVASSQATTAGKLSKADLAEALKRNDEIRALLDRSQTENSVNRTVMVNSARSKLTELENFLKSKGVETAPASQPKSSQPMKKE